jgi:ABC-type bacteriocin/lantibiotic exporter with double-glycine peptidase domain
VPVPAAGIELRDVWFRYDSAGPWVLRGVDRIVVLGEGRVTEKGKHEELLTAGGEYARLFSLQAKGYAMVEA